MAVAPGATLELLVLSADGNHCAGVDLASGALVRAWSPAPSTHRLRPYDVVTRHPRRRLRRRARPPPAGGAGPDAVPRSRCGACAGRRVQRMLRPLAAPPGAAAARRVVTSAVPVLGAPPRPPVHRGGRARRADQPLAGGPLSGLPVRLAGPRTRIAVPGPVRGHAHGPLRPHRHLVAGKGDRLLVALTPPIDGRCHKVVEALLPRP